MNLETLRNFCLSLPNAIETFPFDNEHAVFKVNGKMFALVSIITFESINLKCDPEKAIELRSLYDDVQPGFHMNKKHWNTVTLNNTINDKLLREWIKDSYELVVKKQKNK